jgi:uncharacterized protein DUF4382/carboxypeptidase family protein
MRTMAKTALLGRRIAAAAALAGVAAFAAGCGSGGSSSSSGSGSLSLLMSDAPPNLGNVTAVNVTVTKIEVHPGDGTETTDPATDTKWKTVWQGSQTFNLLSLANVTDLTKLPLLVNRGTLSAGHYDSLRMIIAANSATITVNGQTQPLTVPSGSESGLKSKKFDIANSTDTVLLLDFNVAQSVHQTGNGTFMLKPVIDLAPVTLTASVTGKVVDSTGAPMSALVNIKDASGAVVGSSITTVTGTATSPSPTDGVFAVHGLPSGSYTVEVSATGFTTMDQPETLMAPNTTDAGSLTLTAATGTNTGTNTTPPTGP